MPLTLTINGQPREFAELRPLANVAQLVAAMGLKGDRIAIELNHEIAQRANWEQIQLSAGDRLEIVHFVGGGSQDLDKLTGGYGRPESRLLRLRTLCPITDIMYSWRSG